MTRHDWTAQEVAALYDLPFMDCLLKAQLVHRDVFSANTIQACALLSIKTGACPEDCAYCPQSGHYNTSVEKEKLLDQDYILAEANKAKRAGATRFCMGAAWRSVPQKAMPTIKNVIREVKALGLETCVTLGMLDASQAQDLKQSGLDYYNHNLDTSPEHYKKIISTRTYEDRHRTLDAVREAGIKVCCGGILGMGESREDRIELLRQLANMSQHPKSVPINELIPIAGTPLEAQEGIDSFEFIRTIAVARIMMPQSYLRLAAGREGMSHEMQAWCFFAGANSIFYGDKLLTAANQDACEDSRLMDRLGLQFERAKENDDLSSVSV